MRALLILLLLSFEAGAATRYVTTTGAGATDGSSEANAYAGWADIPGNTFSAGDVLCVIGEINSDTTMKFTDAGSAGNPIIIRGDCTDNPGILDGNNTADPVFQLGDAGLAASYVRVQSLTVRDSHPTTGECITDSSLGAGGGFNEFIDLHVTDCATYNLLLQKPSPTVSDSLIDYCGDDCIGTTSAATSPTITDNIFQYFSVRTLTGDAIFINDAAASSNPVVTGNTCYWDGTGLEKQCFIIGVASGTVTVSDNAMIARVPTSTNHAIAITAATDAYVERNYCEGFNACVTHFAVTAEGIDGSLYARSNIANGSQYAVLFTTSVGTPSLYADNNSGADLVNGLRATATVAANLYVRNNSFRLDGSGGDALYVANAHNSYTGSNNNFGPDAASFIENYECGGSTYATAAAYVAACAQEVGTTSSDPALLGGTSPTTAEGFIPTNTALFRTGAKVGDYNDFSGCRFAAPPSIGAYEMACGGRGVTRSAVTRSAISR